jgi:hypothetical protein
MPPDQPEREIVRRCFADLDGVRYYGEVATGDRVVFVDPEHPRLRARPQRPAVVTGTMAGTMADGFIYCFWDVS